MHWSKNPEMRKKVINAISSKLKQNYKNGQSSPKGMTGKKHSEEWKKEQTEKLKQQYKSGERVSYFKGKVSLMKGKYHTKESNKKNRLAHLGKPSSSKTKFKKGNENKNFGKDWSNQKREEHWNWKGGITSYAMKLRNSIEYIEWRTKVFRRDKFTCQKCKVVGANLNAHHKRSFAKLINTKNEHLIFDIKNGITLCVDCHQKKHPKLNFKIKKR